jgi:hypothetical protein
LVGAAGVVGLEAKERVDCPFRCFFFEEEDVGGIVLLTMGVGSRSGGVGFTEERFCVSGGLALEKL